MAEPAAVVPPDFEKQVLEALPLLACSWGMKRPGRARALGSPNYRSVATPESDMCAAKQARVEDRGKDQYGRTIGRVNCAGADANSEQLRRGMAWVFVKYAPKGSPLYVLEREARFAKRGLWVEPGAVAPWEWRATKRH